MGKEYAAQVTQEMGAYDNAAVQQYVSGLGSELALRTERPKLPWTFTVMDDPQVNAFALPGGYIFITRGIMTHMNSEAELATVVGHEIGHVTARHSVQQMTRQQIAQIGLVAGSIASDKIAQNAGALSQGLGVLFLKYGRDDESQADGLGFRYALNDGYDVRHMVDMFKILQRVSAKAGDRIPEWQSTHPDPGNRIEATEARIQKVTVPLEGTKVKRAEFLRVIDGMVYGDNPRQGIFKGGLFLQPDLAFQIEFPSGWKTANQPSSVVGLSRSRTRRCNCRSPARKRRQRPCRNSWGRKGSRRDRPVASSINGNPAAQGTFTAQNQDGSQIAAGWPMSARRDHLPAAGPDDGAGLTRQCGRPGWVHRQFPAAHRSGGAERTAEPDRDRDGAKGDDADPVPGPVPVCHQSRGTGVDQRAGGWRIGSEGGGPGEAGGGK